MPRPPSSLRLRHFILTWGLPALIGGLQAATLNSGDVVLSDAGTSVATSLVTRVDPATGTRTTITGAGTGSGASLDTAQHVTTSTAGIIYYFESVDPTNLRKLVALDPATGTRTAIAGAAFTAVTSIAWDAATSRILVADAGTSAATSSIIRVDPANGNRTTVTGNGAGSGATFDTAQYIACSPAGTIYYYESVDVANLRKLVAVNPASGARTAIAGAAFTAVTGIAWDNSTSMLIVADAGSAAANSAIIRVNPADGVRTTITGNGVGSGVTFNTASAIGVAAAGTIYYHESVDPVNLFRLVAVDPASGVRAVIPGSPFTAVTSLSVVAASAAGPVTIDTATLAAWTQNRGGYSQTVVASGGTGAKTFAVTSGVLPNGLALDNTSGAITGTPTAAGTFNFTVTATDALSATGSKPLSIVINPPVLITTASLANWTQNRAGYSQTINASGGTGARTFGVTVGALPNGLALNGTTGAVTGTPTVAGTFNFTVTATDTVGAAGAQAYSIVINPPISITTATLADWTVNKSGYSQTIVATGGTGAKTFSVSAGAVPNGLALSSAGLLSGTPTATGTFNFTVTATDTIGAAGSRAYSVVINPELSISPVNLATWTAGAPGYSQTLLAAGGTGTKTFAVTSGAQPTGLSLSAAGLLSGTPTANGTFNFTVTATDAVGATASRAYSVLINPVLAISPLSLPFGFPGVLYNQTATVSGGTGGLTLLNISGYSAGTTGMPAPIPNLATGTIAVSGTPSAPGTVVFTVNATDSVGATLTKAYSISIGNVLTLSPPTLPNWTVFAPGYNQLITASGATGAVTFAVTAGALPSGLGLNGATGAITGTPDTAGTFNFTITATDSIGAPGFRAYSVTIAPAAATVALADLVQPYTGSPVTVSASTTPNGLNVDVTYNGGSTPPTLPGSYAVVATVSDPNYTGTASGTLLVTITGLVRHAPNITSGFDGSLQVVSAENIVLAGTAWISGDLLVPGTPVVDAGAGVTYAGTIDAAGNAAPAGYTIDLTGSAVLRHVVRRIDAVVLPTVGFPPTPSGTRIVALKSKNDSAGDFATVLDLTLSGNAGAVAVPPGTYRSFTAGGKNAFVLGIAGATVPAVYNLQELNLSGNADLQVVGPVVLTFSNGITLTNSIGSPLHPEWLTLQFANGGLTSSRNIVINAVVIAPSGAVNLGNHATLRGRVIADTLILSDDSVVEDPNL